MRARRRWTFAVVIGAACTLLALAAMLGGGGAQGQPAPTVPIGATVYPPFGLALQPGESITVPGHTPTPFPTATPNYGLSPVPAATPLLPHSFPPPATLLDVQIVNDSDTQITVLGDASNFTVTAYDGAIVQLRTSYPLPAGPRYAYSVLAFCGPDNAEGSVVRCRGLMQTNYNAPAPSERMQLHVTTAPQGTTDQQLDLDPGDTAILVWPQNGATAGPGAAISIANSGDSAAIDWDGATLTATVPDGEAIDGSVRDRLPPGDQSSFAALGCATSARENSISCPITGSPQQDITIRSLPLAPERTLTLPYADRYSAGTLTLTPSGPDAAPGGETVSASLVTAEAEFDGSGVLRPEPFSPGEFQLLYTLADGSGAIWYGQGALRQVKGAWAGRGEIVEASQPSGVSNWTLGDPAAAASVGTGPRVDANIADQYGGPGGPPLPALQNGVPLGTPAPALASAGKPIGFEVIGQLPLVSGQLTYGVDFGDGTPPQESAQQEITHTFAAPGTYTLLSYVIDSSGQRSFGVSQITVGPPSD